MAEGEEGGEAESGKQKTEDRRQKAGGRRREAGVGEGVWFNVVGSVLLDVGSWKLNVVGRSAGRGRRNVQRSTLNI
jgi:hypothetical protein